MWDERCASSVAATVQPARESSMQSYGRLYASTSERIEHYMGGELASDNSCDRHEWSSIGHGLRSTPTSVASLHVTLFHSDVAWKRKGEDLQT